MKPLLSLLLFLLLALHLLPHSLADCTCSTDSSSSSSSSSSSPNRSRRALHLKLAAIFSILASGALGVCTPIAGKRIPALQPESGTFFVVKSFSAGVILATGFVHILPDAFESLTSPCLKDKGPWADFPFAGFVAMVAAVGTLMVDSFSTGYYSRAKNKVGEVIEESQDEERGASAHGHGHGHRHEHGHPHVGEDDESQLIRHRVISQVLELGIVVHSVIIGMSLGVSGSASTIRPLIVALTFHQFFEGMGLGGCIVRAKFKARSIAMMILFFSLTTPIGIAVGIGVSSIYNENSSTALVVQGILNSAAAGILIYMALVDLLAADFMSPQVQGNGRLQLVLNISLLIGAGLMSMLAKWA